MIRAAGLVAGVALCAGAAFAQSSQEPRDSGLAPSVDVGTPLPQRDVQAPTQISATVQSAPAESQLTSAHASKQEPRQLTAGIPTAQPPAPLSSPAEGRTAAIEAVHGSDRCDAAIPKAKQSAACKKVIESRADEYTRPQPAELSPEQRLLIDQQLRNAGDTVTDATRRLATTGEPDASTESQGIASIVLASPEPKQEPQKPQDPTSQAGVQAVIQMISQTPQN